MLLHYNLVVSVYLVNLWGISLGYVSISYSKVQEWEHVSDRVKKCVWVRGGGVERVHEKLENIEWEFTSIGVIKVENNISG
jgi:hypothetical protein